MIPARLPVPATFLVVVVAIVILIIFFGAWAVSADVSDRDRALAFGFASGGVTPNTQSEESAQAKAGQAGTTDAEAASEGDVDGWWSSAFLKACPFH